MFEFGKNIFLGVDVGTSSIKMVEIKVENGKPELSNYAWMPVPDLPDKNDSAAALFETSLPLYLKKIIKEAGFKSRNAYVSIPSFDGLVTIIDFPEMAKEDMEQAIRFEAHKYIPMSLDEVVLSWEMIGNRKTSEEIPNANNPAVQAPGENPAPKARVQVLLVAASKNKVLQYEKLISKVGLRLKSIELESFPMIMSLVGNDPGRFVIVDIGSRICNIILVEAGMIKINRNIDAGGKNFTATIAKSLGVDEERAEKLKISGKDFFNSDSYINFNALDLISEEIKRMLAAYFKSGNNSQIDGIILSGGTAKLFGITDYFSKSFNTKVTVGNPFGRIQYNKKLDPVLARIGTQFTVSAGLALKGATEYILKK